MTPEQAKLFEIERDGSKQKLATLVDLDPELKRDYANAIKELCCDAFFILYYLDECPTFLAEFCWSFTLSPGSAPLLQAAFEQLIFFGFIETNARAWLPEFQPTKTVLTAKGKDFQRRGLNVFQTLKSEPVLLNWVTERGTAEEKC